MFKKLFLASALFITCSSIAIAAPYLGVKLSLLDAGVWQLKNPVGKTTDFNSQGATIGLFAGYGCFVNPTFYLGGEIFADSSYITTGKRTIDSFGTRAKLKATYGYGISLIPGLRVGKDAMIYARAGIVRTRFELDQNPSSNIFNFPEGNTITGGQLGAGVQVGLTKHVALRGECVYTKYNKLNENDNRIYANNNQINLGLIYKFG